MYRDRFALDVVLLRHGVSSTVSKFTSTACSTITTCQASATTTTTTTTVSTSTSSPTGFYCSPDSKYSKVKRSASLDERSLGSAQDNENLLEYFEDQSEIAGVSMVSQRMLEAD